MSNILSMLKDSLEVTWLKHIRNYRLKYNVEEKQLLVK
jgi:hypothetical protein